MRVKSLTRTTALHSTLETLTEHVDNLHVSCTRV